MLSSWDHRRWHPPQPAWVASLSIPAAKLTIFCLQPGVLKAALLKLFASAFDSLLDPPLRTFGPFDSLGDGLEHIFELMFKALYIFAELPLPFSEVRHVVPVLRFGRWLYHGALGRL